MVEKISTEYKVPEQNLSKLLQKLEVLNRKAERLGCAEITFTKVGVEDVEIKDNFGKPTGQVQRYIVCELTGDAPMIGGYRFVATVQHEEAGNIIRTVPGESVPEEFRTRSAECDHCKKVRNRKDTYIVANDKEYLQVGSACLKDFTGANNPHNAAAYAEMIINLENIFDDLNDYGHSMEYRFNLVKTLTWTMAVVRKFGWMSKSKAWGTNVPATATLVVDGLLDGEKFSKRSGAWIEDGDEEKAEEVIEWVKNFIESKKGNVESDYLWNIAVIIESETITWRSIGLACSILPLYWKETEAQRRAEEAVSEYVGEIKVRQDFTGLTLHKVIVVDGFYGTTKIHKFTDENENELVWFASNEWLDEGKVYSGKATVKKHEEYNGIKQTVITRCKFEAE